MYLVAEIIFIFLIVYLTGSSSRIVPRLFYFFLLLFSCYGNEKFFIL